MIKKAECPGKMSPNKLILALCNILGSVTEKSSDRASTSETKQEWREKEIKINDKALIRCSVSKMVK